MSSTTKAFALAVVALLVDVMYKPQSLDFVVASGASLAASSAQEAAQKKTDSPASLEKEKKWVRPPAVSGCTNKDERCDFWAEIGECAKNPGYMRQSCAASCGTCEEAMLPYEERCLALF